MQNQPPDFQNQPNSGQPPIPPAQPPNYNQNPGYGQPPPPSYGQPPPSYGQPPGYGQPPPNYGQPANYTPYQPATNPAQSYDEQLQQARAKQNLGLGIVGGLVGALIGAVVWVAIAYITEYEVGLAAILIGFLAGFGVRQLGKGVEPIFGIAAAVLALFGWAVGSLGAAYAIITKKLAASFANSYFFEAWLDSFRPLDILFVVLAVVFGYITAMQNVPKKPKVG
jgi:hypothetical protein